MSDLHLGVCKKSEWLFVSELVAIGRHQKTRCGARSKRLLVWGTAFLAENGGRTQKRFIKLAKSL